MVSEKKYTLDKDRKRALLALSSQDHSDKGACPSPVELAAFIDGGGVESKDRDAILAHLDVCPKCYNEWLAVSATLSDEGKMSSEDSGLKSRKTLGWFDRNRTYMTYGMATAASIILVISFFLFTRINAPYMIKEQYQIALSHNISPKESDFLKTLGEKEGAVLRGYGFADTEKPSSPAAQSFVSGIQTGWKHLHSGKEPENVVIADEWKDYFWMGRWYALISAVCQSDQKIPENFWEKQHKTIDIFQNKFSSRAEKESEAMIIARSLERMKTLMAPQQIDQRRIRRAIKLELRIVIEGIAAGGKTG